MARTAIHPGEHLVEQLEGRFDGVQGALCSGQVTLDQERLQALQVFDRLEREADAIAAHAYLSRDRACSSWRLRVFSAASLDT